MDFIFLRKKKELFVSLFVYSFPFFNYCLVVASQQPSEKAKPDLPHIPHPPRSPALAQEYLTLGAGSPQYPQAEITVTHCALAAFPCTHTQPPGFVPLLPSAPVCSH